MAAAARTDIRNIAIIAHVDHGKTTLVDHMLQQSGTFRDNQVVAERVMDSNDLEREKGITIMAKNASVHWNGTKINIVDTPGHSDFGGEVERILSMVDGVLLLVDAAEGPLPQTRFVLRKALDMGLQPIVVINKIDRSDARPKEVLDEVMELFMNLGASYEQLDFPILYAIGKLGMAKDKLEDESGNLDPLFAAVIKHIPPPVMDAEQPFAMVISALAWSDYVGRIAIGRVSQGRVKTGDSVALIKPDGTREVTRITKMYVFEGIAKVEVAEAEAAEVIALSGFENVFIGETICNTSITEPLSYVNIDEPTIAMYFMVNTSPLAGREGKFVTTPKLRDRLYRELRNNVSLRVEDTDSPDVLKVSGRGELQLAILIETMRREGFEFAVSRPEVLFRRTPEGKLEEPIEHVTVDVPQEHVGTVIENLGRRKGEMTAMNPGLDAVRCEFLVPARGLIGFRTEFLTNTRGDGVIHHTFDSYQPFKGAIGGRARGALVSMETGNSTSYALEMIQVRGTLFVEPGVAIYEGMIIGENAREDDLSVNACRTKHLTNMRASGSDGIVKLESPKVLSLEQCIEFLEDDELLEVTPQNIRLRKKILDTTARQRAKKRESADTSAARAIAALLVPFLMLASAVSASAQDVNLRYKLKKNEAFAYTTRVGMELKMSVMDQEMANEIVSASSSRSTVTDVVMNSFTIRNEFDSISTSVISAEGGPDNGYTVRPDELKGVSVVTVLTPRGIVESKTPVFADKDVASTAAAKAAASYASPGTPQYVIYPAEAVAKGATWKHAFKDAMAMPGGTGGDLLCTYTLNYTLVDFKDTLGKSCAVIKAETSNLTIAGTVSQMGMDMVINGEGTSSIRYVVERANGMPLACTGQSGISARMAVSGQTQMIIPLQLNLTTNVGRKNS